ncbi:MAG: hypothetical protein U5L95_01005 [Candidatus Saccharibacteria bacterium]|nr:hypothetical protein [Candidatus Saccharibacteria bacterium]
MSQEKPTSLNGALHLRFMTPSSEEFEYCDTDSVIIGALQKDPEQTLDTITGVRNWAEEHACTTDAGIRIISRLIDASIGNYEGSRTRQPPSKTSLA